LVEIHDVEAVLVDWLVATYQRPILKHFTLVIYDPRVVIWDDFKSGTTLES